MNVASTVAVRMVPFLVAFAKSHIFLGRVAEYACSFRAIIPSILKVTWVAQVLTTSSGSRGEYIMHILEQVLVVFCFINMRRLLKQETHNLQYNTFAIFDRYNGQKQG